ncbi:MAG TPA: Ig-like domain-containing protein [Anaeromyxobacteraceae bacterium]|nr:Ig-like domain-containing protein [Anaeromyxobacteraceae bacterium]
MPHRHAVLLLLAAASLSACGSSATAPAADVALDFQPASVQVRPGDQVQFTATVTGTSNRTVLWSVSEGSACGSITQNGLYTAPTTSGATCHVTVKSAQDSRKSKVAVVTVTNTPTVGVAVSPGTTTVASGGAVTFTALVTGATNTGVTWAVTEPTGCGAVSQTGVYTAPSTAAGATCHVTVTSLQDSTKSATATVTVEPAAAVAVTVSPTNPTVAAGGTVAFAASVTGTSNTAVAWSVVESASCGTVSAAGLYAAPSPGATVTCHVVVTSVADATKSAQATVTVTPAAPAVAVSPASATIPSGSTVQLTAAVTGATSGSVGWSVVESGCGSVSSTGLYTGPTVTSPLTCHVTASLAGSSATATATVQVNPPAAVPLGVNLDSVSSDSAEHLFADVVKQAREFYDNNQAWGTYAAVDAAGWPTVDAVVFLGSAGAHLATAGAYKVSFTGTASLQAAGGTLSNVAYDAASNTTTADFTVSSNADTYLKLVNAWRRADHAADASGNTRGATNISVLRPGHGKADVFSHELLAGLANFKAVRPHVGMNGVNGNGQTLANWADRVTALSPLQTFYQKPQAGYGIAWEYYVLLANTAGVDLYLTLPMNLTDDHVTRLAQLLRYGSDGVNPYTNVRDQPGGPQGKSPEFPPLAAGLKVYVEYVNEIWNGVFWTTGQMVTLATNEYSAGDPYHYATTDAYDRMRMRAARRTVEISNQFRAVWGDADMGTRVKMVYGCWMANGSYHPNVMYTYVDRVYGTANAYGNPGHPVSWYIQAIAPANYLPDTGNDPGSVDGVFSFWGTTGGGLYASMDAYGTWAKAHPGIELMAYEGGEHLLGSTGGASWKLAAQSDPRMQAVLLENYHRWFNTNGGGMAFYYTLVGAWGNFGYWGLSRDVTDETGPKWQAVKQLVAGQ